MLNAPPICLAPTDIRGGHWIHWITRSGFADVCVY